MKRKHVISKSVSALIVAVLVITAFTREPLKVRLLIGAFAVWGICLIIRALRRKKSESVEEPMDFGDNEDIDFGGSEETEPPDGTDSGMEVSQ